MMAKTEPTYHTGTRITGNVKSYRVGGARKHKKRNTRRRSNSRRY